MSLQDAMLPSLNDSLPTGLPGLPANVLEMVFPRHLSILKLFLKKLNLDVSLIVTLCLSALALWTWMGLVSSHAYKQISTWFMSSVSISSDDELFERILAWLAEQNILTDSRTLIAKSKNGEDSVENREGFDWGGSKTLKFNSLAPESGLQYEPYFGQHLFFYKKRLFLFQRELSQAPANVYGRSPYGQSEIIQLTCIGRSTQPIKNLVMDTQARYLEKQESLTAIRRPAPKNLRGMGRLWSRITTRPSRSMDTVVLDPGQKSHVISDINEYLHPETSKWYANRGIPYRRGYLFHGPSGTGKTSFATALAGTFGIDIFVISLLDPSLTEEELVPLFSELPQRCIVLLEDIDSAGLSRSNVRQSGGDFVELNGFGPDSAKNNGISLSGLLNAIDGVASHEGRILVMTTNYPERLDSALLRPGRVDIQVRFSMAIKPQIRELFMRMYASSGIQPELKLKQRTANGNAEGTSLSLDDLEDIASKFAELIPEHEFTPAEIQGFLLTKKNEPERALAEVQEWKKTMMETKRRNVVLTDE